MNITNILLSSTPANNTQSTLDNESILIIIMVFLILIIIALTIALIILHYRTKAKIESLQMRIDNNLTNEEQELLDKALKLDDNGKAKIANILSENNTKNLPKDGD